MAALIKSSSAIVIYFIFVTASAYSDVVFEEHLIDGNSQGNPSLVAGDIDDDGDQDIVGAVMEAGDVVWWRNDGGYPISWQKFIIDYDVPVTFSVYVEDIDGDGHLDVLGTAYYEGLVLWWKNSGQPPITWTRYVVGANFEEAHEVYACDIDNDGDTDVLGASSALSRITLWLNEGGDPIQWTEVIIDDYFDTAKSVRAADINGDGLMDIIGAAMYGNDVAWWQNDGGNPITWTKYIIDGNFIGAHRVEAVDLDLDGDNDIVGAGVLGHEIAWWRNEGGDPIVWTKQLLGTNFINACVAMPGDIDGDGDIDVTATAQGGNQVAWWENDGNEPIVWTKHVIDVFLRPWGLDLADFDGDGDLDVISGSSQMGSNEVKWYENAGTTGIKEEDYQIPRQSIFSYNSPNPFNRSTDIHFSLSEEADINISIYNLAGALIASWEMGTLSAGSNQYRWHGGDLPSGIYFYRISGGGFTGTGKMLLLK
jgi:hypothetical protein